MCPKKSKHNHIPKNFLRVQKLTTAFLGPMHLRSVNKIEIDITYRCNLSCSNCNRSCPQAPSDNQMTVAQIRKFVRESIENHVGWESIRLLGGEPTLHPDLLTIISILSDYKKKVLPDLYLAITTNGSGDAVKNVLNTLNNVITIENTNKEGKGYNFHIDFNNAPADYFWNAFVDYSNACWIPRECGIGLTPYGYYCCTVAGSIDRVFGFNIGRKVLPSKDDSMKDQMRIFCRLCGHFFGRNHLIKRKISRVWKEAYAKYNVRKPSLIPY